MHPEPLYEKVPKSVVHCALRNLNDTLEEINCSERKLFVNILGSILCTVVFIMENHVKECWLMKRFTIIVEPNITIIVQVKGWTIII